ncbi:hypothetical protein COB11_05965 [Candidatus Aerophobetes bacterium]|uniref:Uncharacterized protein n=1 Tax=Aerophobetes bacterium TaxID=2030807 RepID=A0A2A4YEN9_UNCAE|nr:MAG: hypothetical protein COB11_05965 [Candidatus Aerophobetes bacterium]
MSAFRPIAQNENSLLRLYSLNRDDSGLGSPSSEIAMDEVTQRVQELSLSAKKIATNPLDNHRSDTPAPCMEETNNSEIFKTIGQQDFVKDLSPSFIKDSVSYENVRTTILNGFDAYTAFFFVLLLGSKTFVDVMRDNKRGDEVENNILKEKIIIPFIEKFQKTGILDLRKSRDILIRLYDAMKRTKRKIAETLKHRKVSVAYPPGLQWSRSAPNPVMLDPMQARKARKLLDDRPKMIEHICKFKDKFDTKNTFSVLVLPKEGHTSTKHFLKTCKIEPGTKCIVLVRPDDWKLSEQSMVFPSECIEVHGKKYKLKALSLFTPMEHRNTYKSYIFEGNTLFANYSCYANSEHCESYIHDYTPKDIFGSEDYFTACSKDITQGLRRFVTQIMVTVDMFVYEEISEMAAPKTL